MKRQLRRMGIGLLVLALLLPAAGCGGDAGGSAAMGRYVERTLSLPPTAEILALQAGEDGVLNLLGYEKGADHYVDLAWYRSSDGGMSWEREDCPALEEINGVEEPLSAEAAAWSGDGRLHLLLGDYENTPRLAVTEAGGTLSYSPLSLPDELFHLSVQHMAVTEAGDLLIDSGEALSRVDGSTGAVLNTYPLPDDTWVDGWALNGDAVLLSCGDQLVFYTLDGAQTGTVSCAVNDGSTRATYTYQTGTSRRVLAPGPDGSFYFADADGLCRVLPGSSVLERLADASLTSLGAPSLQRVSLTAAGDRLLLLGYEEGSGYVLLAYAYDPDVPTLPGQALSVWSLQDSPLIRQTISAFHTGHPDVHVTYRPALTEGSAVTREDAIRALNTELAAGRGPDVLLLDGLNAGDYIQKETLADLSDLLEPLIQDGTLHPAAARSFAQEDGSLPVVPAQFQVPMIHAPGNAADEITDLSSMLAWLSARRETFNHPLPFTDWSEYLDFFYPLCAASLTREDGTVDEAALTAFLSELAALYELERTHPIDDAAGNGISFDFGALLLSAGASGLNTGNLCGFENLYAAWQVTQNLGDGQIDLLFGQNRFLPVSLLGVNARSEAAGPARDFVLAALSAPVQSSPLEDGLPVRLDALAGSSQIDEEKSRLFEPGEPVPYATFGTTLTDAEGADAPIWLTIEYPPEEFRNEMLARIQALDTPVLYDGTALQLIKDHTAALASGSAPLEEVLPDLLEKLALYQAE